MGRGGDIELIPKFPDKHPGSGIRDGKDMIFGKEIICFEVVAHPFCNGFGHEGNLCLFA